MKNKGFTLIEILAVIIVLSIIIAIAIPLVSNSISNAKEKIYKANEVMLLNAAKNYMYTNHLSYPSEIGEILTINLEELKNNNILGDIKDPIDKNISCEGYITIENIDTNQYDYNAYLKCGDNYITDGYTEEDSIPTEGLVLHLDASKEDSILKDENNNVSQWNDLSGNDYHAIQNDSNKKPIYNSNVLYNKAGILFNKTKNININNFFHYNDISIFIITQYYTLPSSNPGLIHVAPQGKPFSSTNSDKIIGIWVSNSGKVWGRIIDTSGTKNFPQQYTILANQPYIITTSIRLNDKKVKQYINSLLVSETNYNGELKAYGEFGIGSQATEGWHGDIFEILVYNTSLSDIQRELVEQYLGQKWLGW